MPILFAMEDVLDVYQRAFTDGEVLVCLDETSKQHIKETHTPLPAKPGEPKNMILNMNVTVSVTFSCYLPHVRDGGM
jgi:hypothetical protein